MCRREYFRQSDRDRPGEHSQNIREGKISHHRTSDCACTCFVCVSNGRRRYRDLHRAAEALLGGSTKLDGGRQCSKLVQCRRAVPRLLYCSVGSSLHICLFDFKMIRVEKQNHSFLRRDPARVLLRQRAESAGSRMLRTPLQTGHIRCACTFVAVAH